jgi:choline kinase
VISAPHLEVQRAFLICIKRKLATHFVAMKHTLLVLAAGMGSRYGGLKQLDSVGPSGEVVLDYSVHDALRAGCDRIIFVIRRELEKEFRRVILSRYEKSIAVDVVYQDLQDLPEGLHCPVERIKPWGTGHAIWSARRVIQEPFLVVNADDFYGFEAFATMGAFMRETWAHSQGLQMAMVAYPLGNTLSEHGTVARGICSISSGGSLEAIEECTGIVRLDESLIEGMDTQGHIRTFTGNESVSMNFWGFTPEIFSQLGTLFAEFLSQGGAINPKSEFYIPSAVSAIIASGAVPVSVLLSNGHWFGVTYREDRAAVVAAMEKLVAQGIYPSPLWNQPM